MAVPVSLEDAKRQLRQGGEALDAERLAEVTGFITDAAAWVEGYTGQLLVAADVEEQFRVPGRALLLRSWPIKAAAVPAFASDGPTTIAGARLDVTSRPARIVPARGTCWPLTSADQVLTVTIRAGYEPSDTVPGNIRRAMLVLISAYDQDREGGDVFQAAEATARRLCTDLRLRRL